MENPEPDERQEARPSGARAYLRQRGAAVKAAVSGAGRGKEYAAVLLFFFLLAVFFTWPLILHVHNGVVGNGNDTLLNTWIVTWDAKTVFTRPWGLFQGNIIYPSRDVLAYSEHLFAMGVLAAPVYYASGNPILAYNFLLFFAAVLSGFGCYLLVKELTGSRWGGLAAGIFFTFCPYRISKLGHLHVYFSPLLPFVLLYEHRFLEKGGKKNLLAFALLFLAQSLASWHYLVFCAFAGGLMWAWRALFSRRREEWKRLAGIAAAFAVVLVCLLPFALPYMRAHARLPGFERTALEAERMYSISARDLLVVVPHNLLYGGAPGPLTVAETERVCFPGLSVPLLALAALVLLFFFREKGNGEACEAARASRRRAALFFLVLAAAALAVAVGPEVRGITNPFYRVLYDLGALRFIRVPARFYILIALGMAVLAGYGIAALSSRAGAGRGGPRAGRLVSLCLVAVVLLEMASTNLYVFRVQVKGEVPAVYSWLKEQGDVVAIELPTSLLGGMTRYDRDNDLGFTDVVEYHDREGRAMYFSTYHWKKIVNGYSGYYPYFYRRTMIEMQGFPSRRSVELLRGLGVTYLLWNWEWTPPERREELAERLRSQAGLTEVEDFGAHTVFRVEPGPAAGWQDLEISAVCPGKVRAGEGFNLGILARNRAVAPLVMAEENPQEAVLTFRDERGREVLREEATYRAPFFLQAGEAVCLPVYAKKVPHPGSYRLDLSLREGVLGAREYSFNLDVAEIPQSVEPSRLEGEIALVGRERMMLASTDGLLPLDFEAVNLGDTLWRAAWETKEDELLCPEGLVHIAVRWEQDGKKVWEEQRCTLPCDVSPGQSVAVPTLVRIPATPGDYRVFIGLTCEGFHWFGNVLELEVTVGEGGETVASPAGGLTVIYGG